MYDARTDTAGTLRTRDWYKTATRWTQLTLVENDPVEYDPGFWKELFRSSQSNATCLSAGGYIAYYPSKVPFHHVSRDIGDSDPFGELVSSARELGMHVMARVDPHAIHQDAADAHPEWVAVGSDGAPRRHWAYPDVWVTCAYGDYNQVYFPQIVEEITRNYDIDAIFANRWQGHGVCYCDSCRTRFHAASGHDLPQRPDAQDPAWRAWTDWRRDVLTTMIASWDDKVRAIRPHASFIPNMGGASLMEFDLSVIERHCPFLVVDDQGRRGLEPIWKAGRNAKRMRAAFPERPVILITSVGPEEPHRWKDSVTTPAEIEAWMMNGATHGMLPWFTKFNGTISDTRWIEPVERAFALHALTEDPLKGLKPFAQIAIVDAATTLRTLPAEDRERGEADELGFCHALIEAKLPFEFISDQSLSQDALDRFDLVVVPNAPSLSDAQCKELADFVARGENLVVCGETALLDEKGVARRTFPLEAALGARITAPPRGPVKNTYIALGPDHPINAGFEGARRIIGGTRLIGAEALGGQPQPFMAIPDFPDLPMEEVYPREAPHAPAVIARETEAGGRTVYVPWNLGQVFWDVLARDHQRLIENIARWALKKHPAVEVTGKSVLDIALRRDKDRLAVLLFNLTNPMMLKGPIRETWPVGEHQLIAALPDGRTGARARTLVGGRDLPVTIGEGVARMTVPGVDLQEIVLIEWE